MTTDGASGKVSPGRSVAVMQSKTKIVIVFFVVFSRVDFMFPSSFFSRVSVVLACVSPQALLWKSASPHFTSADTVNALGQFLFRDESWH